MEQFPLIEPVLSSTKFAGRGSRRIFLVLVAVIGGLALAGGASAGEGGVGPAVAFQSGGASSAAAQPLSGDALRALLSDVYVTLPRSDGVMVSHPKGEVFRSNGAYQRIVGRPRFQGTFEIVGNRVCVQGADVPRRCRRIIAMGEDRYSFVDDADGSAEIMTISPLI